MVPLMVCCGSVCSASEVTMLLLLRPVEEHVSLRQASAGRPHLRPVAGETED